ncbi:MAG TPA: M20 family metallopeptidase [Candidatus Acidoferrales bacterium]|nr:M20 family metallopeptidase [Candidatus Acidoferrales bacterium]
MNVRETTLPDNVMRIILRKLKSRRNEMVRLLGDFVRCESPSHSKIAVDRLGVLVAKEWRRRGANVRVLRNRLSGNLVRVELWLGEGRSPRKQIMVLGHMDTVYPLGSLAKMPFRVSGGRARGPGTFDMKGGLVLALFAVDALKAAGIKPNKRLVFLWTSDEEVGSESSRRAIEREARRSDAVLVLEPSFGPEGRLKTARNGVGGAEIVVTGRSAHAGVDPEKGVNAVHELALQIQRIMKLNDPQRGITVQATVVGGGTVSNVIPASAHAELDIRYSRIADGAGLQRKLRHLRPILKGAHVEVRGEKNRPPLERTAATRALFRHAQSLMRAMGLPLGEAATGGGSDGNFTAALGVPTLDGLGAVGDSPHSPREYVVIRALPERAALIAGLLASL